MKAPTCLHRQGCAAFAPSHAEPCVPWGSAFPPALALLLVYKHPKRSGDSVSKPSSRCAGRRWEFSSSSTGLLAKSSPVHGTSPEMLLGTCSLHRIHRGLHRSCCWLHPKTERFGVRLASVPGLAVSPLLTWPSVPTVGS